MRKLLIELHKFKETVVTTFHIEIGIGSKVLTQKVLIQKVFIQKCYLKSL
jgi:hypothetical protein